MKAWQNKVVVISGAASGIGEALAKNLAGQGAKLMICDIDQVRLEAVQATLTTSGATVRSRVIDVSSLEAYQGLAQEVKALWGGADVVINNAGVSLIEPVKSMSLEDAQWIMGINFWGVFNACKAFGPQMIAGQKGTLVNISSIFAMVSMPTQSMYNAAKAAVRGFSDALREEMRPQGVQVLCVHPGGIKTRIVEQARFGDISETGQSAQEMKTNFQIAAQTTPESAAAQIIRAVETGQARLLIGKDAKFLDLMFRIFPASASRRFTALVNRRRDRLMSKYS